MICSNRISSIAFCLCFLSLYVCSAGLSPRVSLLHREGIGYAAEGKLPEALEKLAAASALSPDSALVLVDLGWVYGELGRDNDAVSAYRRALAADPDYAPAMNNLGYMLIGDPKTIEEGLKLIKKACHIEPDNVMFLDSLAVALEKNGDMDEALEAYRKAMEIDPHYTPLLENLKNFAEKIGDVELVKQVSHNLEILKLARPAKKKIESEDDRHTGNRNNRVGMSERSTVSAARPSVAGAQVIVPSTEYEMAVKRYEEGEYDSAERLFNSVITRMRGEGSTGRVLVESYRYLGLIMARNGSWERARDYWNRANAARILNLVYSWTFMVLENRLESSMNILERLKEEKHDQLHRLVNQTIRRHLEGRPWSATEDTIPFSVPSVLFAAGESSMASPWVSRAREHISRHEYVAALNELKTALEMSGTEAEVYGLYGWTAMMTGDFSEAADTIKTGYRSKGGLNRSATLDILLAAVYLLSY